MGILSRYYTKQSLQKRIIEEAGIDPEILDDNVAQIYKEVNNIKENLIVYTDTPETVYSGFFGL